jgi:pullulanase/glycogen debranching enzyme
MVEPGHAHPVGAHVVEGGVNFSVFSENADSVELLLFDRQADPDPARVIPLTRDFTSGTHSSPPRAPEPPTHSALRGRPMGDWA